MNEYFSIRGMKIDQIIETLPEPLMEAHRLWQLGVSDKPVVFIYWRLLPKLVIPPVLSGDRLHSTFLNPNNIRSANGVKFIQFEYIDLSIPNTATVLSVNLNNFSEEAKREIAAILWAWHHDEIPRSGVMEYIRGIISDFWPNSHPPELYFMDEPGAGQWTLINNSNKTHFNYV